MTAHCASKLIFFFIRERYTDRKLCHQQWACLFFFPSRFCVVLSDSFMLLSLFSLMYYSYFWEVYWMPTRKIESWVRYGKLSLQYNGLSVCSVLQTYCLCDGFCKQIYFSHKQFKPQTQFLYNCIEKHFEMIIFLEYFSRIFLYHASSISNALLG